MKEFDDAQKSLNELVATQAELADAFKQAVNQDTQATDCDGRQNHRFDVVVLSNGLPLIEVELKDNIFDANEELDSEASVIDDTQ